jgi:hypothetical protein
MVWLSPESVIVTTTPSGRATFTADPAQAMRFDHVGEAMLLYRAQSVTVPTRPHDGEPNRPLTRFTMQVVVVD